jgi:hypothetical protein
MDSYEGYQTQFGFYHFDENASNSSYHDQIQANTILRRIVDNEVEKRKDEHFEPQKNPNSYPSHLAMEYEPKAHFPQYLEEPIENVRVKLNILNAA